MPSPAFMIVEDGSAKTNSNSYWDVESIVTYLTNKGVLDIENYTENQIARAAISSTFYIEKRFKRRYRGLRQTVEQALGWPRIGAFDDDSFSIFGVPSQIQWALAEYTIRAARIGVLAPDPMRTVPTQDLSQPSTGLTPGTATLTVSANLGDGDVVVIGTRSYTLQAALTAGDGHVHLGASAVATLNNLSNAINDAGGTPGTDYNVTQGDPNVTASVTSLTTLVVQSTLATANLVGVFYAPAGTSFASWGSGVTKLSGFSNNPVTPDLILGPVRSKVQKIGPLEDSTTYDGLSQRAIQDERTTRAAQSGIVNDYYIPEYPEADLWIEQLVRNPATGTRLIRGS